MNLKEMLEYYEDLYYNKGVSEITDEEYDNLKEKYLKSINKTEYDFVPGDADIENKVEHKYPVLSLNKYNIIEEDKLRKEIEKLLPVVIQDKFDGGTVAISNKVVTRGNGHIGNDITNKVKNLKGLKNLLSLIDKDDYLRGEIIMKTEDYHKINKERVKQCKEEYSNARAASNGILNNEDISKIKGLSIYLYDVLNMTKSTVSEKMEYLSKFCSENIYAAKTIRFDNVEDAIKYIKEYDRNRLPYQIDGLVVKHDGENIWGSTGHHPNDAIAIKFVSPSAITTLIDIKWEVKRTGRVTPVAILDPVKIDGSIITKATLNNYNIIEQLGLNYLDYSGKYNPVTKVTVIKSNDVIPKITKKHPYGDENNLFIGKNHYIKKIDPIANCPACGSKLETIGALQYCLNEYCPHKNIYRLVNMASKEAFDIRDLSIETAEKLINYYIKKNNLEKNSAIHPSFIYSLTIEDILNIEGFAKISAEKLYKNIQNSKNLKFDKFLTGVGIPLIGKGTAKDIAIFYSSIKRPILDSFTTDYFNDFKQLREVKNIGEKTINSIVKYWNGFLVPFGEIDLTISKVDVPKKVEEPKTFVITGEFEIPRKNIEKMIKDAGHKVTGKVSKKTNYLIASENESSSTKYKDAQKLNIKIIALNELNKYIN